MNIELAPDEYHIYCTYNEAILYCFTLNIDGKTGWRLPTIEEWKAQVRIYGWFVDAMGANTLDIAYCVPVRDL